MVHPFFGAGAFSWRLPQAQALRHQLSIAITAKAEIVQIFQLSGGVLGDLDQNQPPNALWQDVLNLLATGGLLREFCDQLKAIERLRRNVAFQKAIGDVESAKPAVERRRFGDDIVLDRRPLRGLIEILQPDTSRMNVIIVRGGPQSGRSHGRMLFEQAAVEQGAAAIYLYAELVSTVPELIDQLRVALGGKTSDIRPRGETTEDAWHKSVCLDLQAMAQDKKEPLWIVVDDLGPGPDGTPKVDSEVKRFCDQFALSMLNPLFNKWFRLLLIDYPEGPVPTRWKSVFWREDRTSPEDIGLPELVEFLQDWASDFTALITGTDLEQLAADVLVDVETPRAPGIDPCCRLQRLNDSLLKKIRSLEAKAGHP